MTLAGRPFALGRFAPYFGAHAPLGKLIADDTQKWAKVIKDAGIKIVE